MTSTSALNEVHIPGLYGNYKKKNENSLVKISEIKNLLIVQIVQYKNSSIRIEELNIDGLNLKNEALSVVSNKETRILWSGPKNWLLVSTKRDSFKKIQEILKKGCPFNFNILNKNKSINSTFNGIALTIDCIDDDPEKIRLFALRSFGESLYHSITDSSLEFGYKAV